MGEVRGRRAEQLPRLIDASDVKGFLHCHTSYSDGSNTVEQLALACRAAGYEYLGVTDHSQAAAYAGGLSPDDLARQGDEIDEVNSRLDGFRVLKGIEADILQDGQSRLRGAGAGSGSTSSLPRSTAGSTWARGR